MRMPVTLIAPRQRASTAAPPMQRSPPATRRSAPTVGTPDIQLTVADSPLPRPHPRLRPLSSNSSNHVDDYQPQPHRRLSLQRDCNVPSVTEIATRPALVFRNMCAWSRSGKQVLDGITGFMHEGEIMAVMGLSGGGKTTFLRGLVGSYGPRSDIVYSSSAILASPGARIGFMGDNFLPFENLTVLETLRYALVLDTPGLDESRIVKRTSHFLERMDLTDAANRPVHQLSAGQRKRVEILQLLVRSCTIMVMDEPLSALDSFTSLKLMQELRGLVDKERISVILSLHQPRAEVFARLDFVMMIHKGRMAYFGHAHSALDRVTGFLNTGDNTTLKDVLSHHSSHEECLDSPLPHSQPAHALLDVLAESFYRTPKNTATRVTRKRSSSGASEVDRLHSNICDMFAESDAFKALERSVIELVSENKELEPYKVEDRFLMHGGHFWSRCVISSQRFLVDTVRDRSTWLVIVLVAVLLTACVSSVFHGLGGSATLQYPTNQVSFFATLSALLVVLVQLPASRCCLLYRVFRHELMDGNHSAWQFMVETALTSVGFCVFYSLLCLLPYNIAFSIWNINGVLLLSNILITVTAQYLLWVLIFVTNGQMMLAVSTFTAIETIMLACDGFVVPPAFIRAPWVFLYFSNPRTWYLKSNLINLLCPSGTCSSSSSSLTASISTIPEALGYSWISELYSGNSTYNSVVDEYMKVFNDLNGYSVKRSISYSIAILMVVVVVAAAALGASLVLFRYSLKGRNSDSVSVYTWRYLPKASVVAQFLSIGMLVIVFGLSIVYGKTGASTITDAFLGQSYKPIPYQTGLYDYYPNVLGIPSFTHVENDLLAYSDFTLFSARMEQMYRLFIDTVKGIDEMCVGKNRFYPTYKTLNISSLQQILDDYTPRMFSVRMPYEMRNLIHAEGLIARYAYEWGVYRFIVPVATLDQGLFRFAGSTALEQYMRETYNTTLNDALAAGRLYMNERILGFNDLPVTNHIGDTKYLSANPFILFYKNSSTEDLHTVAIQLGDYTSVLVPEDGYGWMAAKAFVRNTMRTAILIGHITRTHMISTTIGLAAEQTFSTDHPMLQVLSRFTQRLTYVRDMSVFLTTDFEMSIGATTETKLTLYNALYQSYNFTSEYDLANWDLEMDQTLYFPWRGLLQEFWSATSKFSESIVDTLYATDEAIVSDAQLTDFVTRLQEPTGGNVPHLTESSCGVCTRSDLALLLTRMMFICIRHTLHNADERAMIFAYLPLAPLNLAASRLPVSGDDFTEEEFLNMFSDSYVYMQQFDLVRTLGQAVQSPISDYVTRATDSSIQPIVQEYVDDLYVIAAKYEQQLGTIIRLTLESFPLW